MASEIARGPDIQRTELLDGQGPVEIKGVVAGQNRRLCAQPSHVHCSIHLQIHTRHSCSRQEFYLSFVIAVCVLMGLSSRFGPHKTSPTEASHWLKGKP